MAGGFCESAMQEAVMCSGKKELSNLIKSRYSLCLMSRLECSDEEKHCDNQDLAWARHS